MRINRSNVESGEPKVTVGLPTYNRAELLPDCVRAVLSQTYNNWELIISDDNSTDTTPEVARTLVKLDNRIKYYRQDCRTFLPKNRNTICSMATSDLIFFIEDDVVIDTHCIATLIRSFQELSTSHKIAAIVPRMITDGDVRRGSTSENEEIVSIDGWTGLVRPGFDVNSNLPVSISTGHACSLISKEAWREIGGYEEKRYKGTNFREETDFYFRARQKGWELYFEPRAVIYHLKHDVGGCRLSSQLKDDYFYARNHILFVLRFYKLQSIYMIPSFILHLLSRLIKRALNR